MTDMEHVIEKAADVLGAHQWSAAVGGCRGGSCQWHGGDSEDEQERHAAHVARALAEAGLLAPSPLRKEWGVRWHPDDPAEDIWDHYIDRRDAESGAGDEGEVVFRYVTDGGQE